MALFFHSTYKNLKITLKGSKAVITPSGNRRVIRRPKQIKFKGGRFETDDEYIIKKLRAHKDYNVQLFEIDKDAHEARNRLIAEGIPTLHICPFCDGEFETKADFAVHIPACAKNPSNLSDAEATKLVIKQDIEDNIDPEEEEDQPIDSESKEEEESDDDDYRTYSRNELMAFVKENEIPIPGNISRLKNAQIIAAIDKHLADDEDEEGLDERTGDSEVSL